MARLRRAYQPELPAQAGAEIALSADEAHHVRRVLRLREGDSLCLFDGKGRETKAVLLRCDTKAVTARIEEEIVAPVEAPVRVQVYQAFCRPDRMEWLIQKLTEIGVASIHPMQTERVETGPPGKRLMQRWRRIVVEACKQSGRRLLPELEPLAELPAAERGVLPLILDPGKASPPLGDRLPPEPPQAVWLAVGPEGGFGEEEVASAASRGWLSADLGPRTLRTESAALVVAAILLHRWGDLG